MTRTDFILKIAGKGGYTNDEAEKAMKTVIGAIEDVLADGDSVSFIGFGSFSVRDRKARKSYDPRKKEITYVPAKKVPVFKAGQTLKSKVNKLIEEENKNKDQ